jgi:biotin-dependent carboxylase-like uncharacterized protein
VTSFLNILQPGLVTSVQDLGRAGYQRLGIGPSGALDPVALRAANLLIGNEPGEGALEIIYLGPTIKIEAESVRLSFAGASATIEILSNNAAGAANGSAWIAGQRSVVVRRGDIVKIGSLTGSACLYVGVEGGLAVDPTMGSVSTNIRAGTGGWHGRALAAGDQLPLRRVRASDRDEYRLEGITFLPSTQIRVTSGPQHDYFDEANIARFFQNEYTVSTSDRVGMRLMGDTALHHCKGFNIASDAIAPGSIQIPGNGQPIVLMTDRQTTGGYPKIATVISADLPALGRLFIGAKLRFEQVSMDTAHVLRRRMLSFLEDLKNCVVPISSPITPTISVLSDRNLISGVIDAIRGAESWPSGETMGSYVNGETSDIG